MAIIIKLLWKNLAAKKSRSLLIIVSVAVASALFFASYALSGNYERMYTQRLRRYCGSSQIQIKAGADSPSPFFYKEMATPFHEDMEYIIGAVEEYGALKAGKSGSGAAPMGWTLSSNVMLMSIALEDMQAMNPVVLDQQSDVYPFSGRKIIIGQQTAKVYGLNVGDFVDLFLKANKYRFQVCGICIPKGPMEEDAAAGQMFAIVPPDAINTIYGARGKVNTLYMKVKDPAEKDRLLEELSKTFGRHSVKETVTQEEISENYQSTSTSFFLMTAAVSLMSIFIIRSSFQVIAAERMPFIGTLKSIGATKGKAGFLLALESLLYGIIGGTAGCGFGIAFLYIIAGLMVRVRPGETIIFTPEQLAAAFALAIALCILSALPPIVKASRTSVKQLLLGAEADGGKKGYLRLIPGILIAMLIAAAPLITPAEQWVLSGAACMILSAAFVVLIIPPLSAAFAKAAERPFAAILGNIGALSLMSLRGNKKAFNNISLLAIGISCLMMVQTVQNSIYDAAADTVNSSKSDITFRTLEADRKYLQRLYSINGISDLYATVETSVEFADGCGEIGLLEGIDTKKHLDYWKIAIPGDARLTLAKLEEGRNILMSNRLREKYRLREGDTIALNLNRGVRPYNIVGFFDTNKNNGECALISHRYLKLDTGVSFYTHIYIKTSKDPKEVVHEIQTRFPQRLMNIKTSAQIMTSTIKSYESLFLILRGFLVLALLIGIVGMINNLLISLLSRRRSLAMLRSLGMAQTQIVWMLLLETVTAGSLGGFMGIVAGMGMVSVMPYVLEALNNPVKIRCDGVSMTAYVVFGMLIPAGVSLVPMRKASKWSIIDSIRQE